MRSLCIREKMAFFCVSGLTIPKICPAHIILNNPILFFRNKQVCYLFSLICMTHRIRIMEKKEGYKLPIVIYTFIYPNMWVYLSKKPNLFRALCLKPFTLLRETSFSLAFLFCLLTQQKGTMTDACKLFWLR
jgi:hypothetical protein